MYRFSFLVADTEDSDVYSPFHGEDRKLRFEDSLCSNDGWMTGGSEEAKQLRVTNVFGIYGHLSA